MEFFGETMKQVQGDKSKEQNYGYAKLPNCSLKYFITQFY